MDVWMEGKRYLGKEVNQKPTVLPTNYPNKLFKIRILLIIKNIEQLLLYSFGWDEIEGSKQRESILSSRTLVVFVSEVLG